MRNRKAQTQLDAAIVSFVAHQRIFGRGYFHEEYILRALGKFAAAKGAADLSASIFDQWSETQRQLSPNTLYGRQLLVRKMCLHRRRSEPGCFVPDASGFTRPRPYPAPVIVTRRQVAALLWEADQLTPSRYNPLRAATIRIAIVLLYTAGLRRGELVRLQLADVDAEHGLLHIRESKFHKSRWIPLSSDARRELREYLRKRMRKPFDLRPTSPLLCNRSRAYGHVGWHAFCGPGLAQGLLTLFDRARVRDPQGRCPRVQDMRHSFAVEALVRWYRQGGDVQTHLPKLALFMGHVSIVSTAHYLHFIPQVAALASKRFDRHFSRLIEPGAL
jgi:integrase/recombinase XerD